MSFLWPSSIVIVGHWEDLSWKSFGYVNIGGIVLEFVLLKVFKCCSCFIWQNSNVSLWSQSASQTLPLQAVLELFELDCVEVILEFHVFCIEVLQHADFTIFVRGFALAKNKYSLLERQLVSSCHVGYFLEWNWEIKDIVCQLVSQLSIVILRD